MTVIHRQWQKTMLISIGDVKQIKTSLILWQIMKQASDNITSIPITYPCTTLQVSSLSHGISNKTFMFHIQHLFSGIRLKQTTRSIDNFTVRQHFSCTCQVQPGRHSALTISPWRSSLQHSLKLYFVLNRSERST